MEGACSLFFFFFFFLGWDISVLFLFACFFLFLRIGAGEERRARK